MVGSFKVGKNGSTATAGYKNGANDNPIKAVFVEDKSTQTVIRGIRKEAAEIIRLSRMYAKSGSEELVGQMNKRNRKMHCEISVLFESGYLGEEQKDRLIDAQKKANENIIAAATGKNRACGEFDISGHRLDNGKSATQHMNEVFMSAKDEIEAGEKVDKKLFDVLGQMHPSGQEFLKELFISVKVFKDSAAWEGSHVEVLSAEIRHVHEPTRPDPKTLNDNVQDIVQPGLVPVIEGDAAKAEERPAQVLTLALPLGAQSGTRTQTAPPVDYRKFVQMELKLAQAKKAITRQPMAPPMVLMLQPPRHHDYAEERKAAVRSLRALQRLLATITPLTVPPPVDYRRFMQLHSRLFLARKESIRRGRSVPPAAILLRLPAPRTTYADIYRARMYGTRLTDACWHLM